MPVTADGSGVDAELINHYFGDLRQAKTALASSHHCMGSFLYRIQGLRSQGVSEGKKYLGLGDLLAATNDLTIRGVHLDEALNTFWREVFRPTNQRFPDGIELLIFG